MQWLQLIIRTTREGSVALEDVLLEYGAASVTLEDAQDQPILEPALGEMPLWDAINLKVLFSADTDTALLNSLLKPQLPENSRLRWEQLEDKDWSQEWKKYFQPLPCGERLWIVPSWMEPPRADAVNLILDPGLAFGTGSHPTTHLCLRWLDRQQLAGKTVIDYGCGSGILGIAALLLGADKVIAVDNDPQALVATANNAKNNNIETGRIQSYLPHQVPEDIRAPVVVANILAAPLVELAPTLSAHTEDNGLLCLSGLLENQIDLVSAPYLAEFTFSPPQIDDNWAQLDGRKSH